MALPSLIRRLFGRYAIEDPRPVAENAPYTFELPSENELLAVAPGDLVKLMFRSIPAGQWEVERMWVIVTAADGAHLAGTLDNHPGDMPQLKAGDRVSFERRHIIDIMWDDNRTVPPPPAPERRDYWDRCFVDNAILDGRRKVEFLYREEPDPPRDDDKFSDSGWRIESDPPDMFDIESGNAPFSYVALGAVLNRDDSWLHLIDAPVGSAFERDPDTGRFVAADMPVHDPE
ncbi:immunity protein Imm33 domain-containing protein [Sphingopyxis macrogoltabida]|uniref:DUF2185 domain-containing protein n=1 Tax=Sphingopyxis macrogoltabida TaxID=33050 RepID=A0AAC9FG15_SPHMC|nr:DUF2185 domain-containing protein [Sphingopyxis macrogoltabida]ALJ14809.1 hypothetical protein LH19_18215 [Sphingopyxis macrogoltabida]AMU91063.1 hypothetical protein ATM17_18780 [Sphingopyxis macrogoltabida]